MQTVFYWAGGITAVLGLVALLWKPYRRLDALWRDWTGEPKRDGVPARPGVMRRLAEHDEILRDVRAQLHPNGGSSLRDDVNATRAAVTLLLRAQGLALPTQPPTARERTYASSAVGRHRAV